SFVGEKLNKISEGRHDVVVIGAGMAGLTAAALLVKRGLRVCVLEQNWLPGGCASSYPRHGFVFEAGATTLVGLDEGMPLRYLLDETGIEVPAVKLDLPMQVHLPDGGLLSRYQDLEQWIGEAERVFGAKGQRAFWEYCFRVSRDVWASSLQQQAFPPTRLRDVGALARRVSWKQLRQLPRAFKFMTSVLKRFGLEDDALFRRFVDAQLLITAQNDAEEVNALFGATALCYTNDGNYYVNGGMLELVKPLVDYIEKGGGNVYMRQNVTQIEEKDGHYRVQTHRRGKATQATFEAPYLVSAIPLNNTLDLFPSARVASKTKGKLLPPSELRSAFSMGIAFKRRQDFPSLHHQLLLPTPLPQIQADSIFISLSHPDDPLRCAPDECVASISTHIFNPHEQQITDKAAIEAAVVNIMAEKGFLRPEDILYQHSSSPKAWEKWTGRAHGFVGGYPQYRRIKPWQMKDARLDGRAAYICGDSTYPGQGIPGACLSGIALVEKMRLDHRI
ncbi:MAG: NAD(P)/FAD-dependent oxidoreductase, partial [Bacteroidota bacterium]